MKIERKPREKWPACVSCGKSSYSGKVVYRCEECSTHHCYECEEHRSRQVSSHRLEKSKHCPQCGGILGDFEMSVVQSNRNKTTNVHTDEVLEICRYTPQEQTLLDEYDREWSIHSKKRERYSNKQWWHFWIKDPGPWLDCPLPSLEEEKKAQGLFD